jgi:hypothetical protein
MYEIQPIEWRLLLRRRAATEIDAAAKWYKPGTVAGVSPDSRDLPQCSAVGGPRESPPDLPVTFTSRSQVGRCQPRDRSQARSPESGPRGQAIEH